MKYLISILESINKARHATALARQGRYKEVRSLMLSE